MKVLLGLIFLWVMPLTSHAQQDEDVKAFISRVGWQASDTNFWKKITINQILEIPIDYTVITCDFVFASKGEIFRMNYDYICGPAKTGGIGSRGPSGLPWIMNALTAPGAKGNKFMVDNIQVRKGDRTYKLKSKAIIAK